MSLKERPLRVVINATETEDRSTCPVSLRERPVTEAVIKSAQRKDRSTCQVFLREHPLSGVKGQVHMPSVNERTATEGSEKGC